MSGETIELLHNYKPENMAWPAAHQEKIDGVPVCIMADPSGRWHAYTRQGEVLTSIGHIIQEVSYLFHKMQYVSIIGELYIEGLPFKTISGHARKNKACTDLKLHIFDCAIKHPYTGSTKGWQYRMLWLENALSLRDIALQHMHIEPWTICQNEDDAERAHSQLMRLKPKAEGSVLHSCGKQWEPGKRSWHVQRMKPVPTIDLLIVSVEEARSATGAPLGMVGRLNAELTTLGPSGLAETTIVGIGPGKLSHPERKALWSRVKAGTFKPRIAEIKYMRDDTYDALRQPTFQSWRDDKLVPDRYDRAA